MEEGVPVWLVHAVGIYIQLIILTSAPCLFTTLLF